jgi:lysyl-tRNA synthetase class 2
MVVVNLRYPRIRRGVGARRLAALATALVGIVTLVSSLSPNAPARQRLLEGLEPGTAQAVAHAIGVLGGLALLWLALGVLHGRRRAGRVAIVMLGLLAVVHAAKGLDYEEALLGLAIAFVLQRALKAGPNDGRASRLVLIALIGLIALAAAYAVSLTLLLISGHSAELGPAAVRAAQTVGGAGRAVAVSGAASVGLHLLIALAVGSLVLLLRAVLAPAHGHDGHSPAEHRVVADLVARHGEDSIAPFALRADKAFHFASGAAVAYRVLRETAVVSGDPVGPRGSAGPAMASFLSLASQRGWDVVVLGASANELPAYRALGLHALQVGLEAVVDPRVFSLEGRAMRTARKATNRVARAGWSIEVLTGAQLGGRVSREVLAVEEAWRRSHRRLYGFAMAGDRLWGAPEDATDVYAVARNPAGEIRAFQRYVCYRGGLSLDAMRRLDDEPNGIADSLVAAVLCHARDRGCREVSLNFSGFGHLMAADTLERRSHRLARWLLQRLHGRFQLERLARFAEKFRPEWRPRYVVYTGRTRLPLAALRIMQAEAYIRPPAPRPRRDAWLPGPMPVRP